MLAPGSVPVSENRGDGVVFVLVDRNGVLLALELEVSLRVAVVYCLQRFTLGRIALTHHLPKLGAAQLPGNRREPAAGRDRGQLAAVADDDHLRASAFATREQLSGRPCWR